jgi:hypothetical protein
LSRPSDQYKFPTTPALTLAISHLLKHLQEDNVQEQLHQIFMALWKTTWRTSRTNNMPDPTMCFLTLFACKSSGEFMAPKIATGVIAKLCRGIQLAMIHEIHRLVDSGDMPHQIDAMEFLAFFVREKEPTTFHSLMSLQHYATTLAYQTMSLPRIWWLDRVNWHEMLYLGQLVTYQHITQVFINLEDQIINLWENKILLGLNLHVEYGVINDNLLHTEPGYCFIDDANNPFSKHKTTLSMAILDDPNLAKRFIIQGNLWNTMACREWLVNLAEMEGLLMAAIDMKGALSRATELMSMLLFNTELRLRNGMALGSHIAIVRQYDKTTNIAQSDRLVPCSIDAVDSDIFIQLHTLARPFAQVSLL